MRKRVRSKEFLDLRVPRITLADFGVVGPESMQERFVFA